MENMLDLLNEEQEVKDLPNALPIVVSDGKIEFKNVTFHYAPERVILKDISFMARPGETIALVSSVFFLMVSFFDDMLCGCRLDPQAQARAPLSDFSLDSMMSSKVRF